MQQGVSKRFEKRGEYAVIHGEIWTGGCG